MRVAGFMSKVSIAVGGAAVILAAYAGCSAAQTVQAVKSPPIMASFMATAGYLSPEALPDGLLLIPPPPAPGSRAEARDQEASRTALVRPISRTPY